VEPGDEQKAAGYSGFRRLACKMATGAGKTAALGLDVGPLLEGVTFPTVEEPGRAGRPRKATSAEPLAKKPARSRKVQAPAPAQPSGQKRAQGKP
jgi:hypothetical protein